MLIQFGLMRDLIRRLQKYPVLTPPEADEDDVPLLPELEALIQ